jgi:hypothetical protein
LRIIGEWYSYYDRNLLNFTDPTGLWEAAGADSAEGDTAREREIARETTSEKTLEKAYETADRIEKDNTEKAKELREALDARRKELDARVRESANREAKNNLKSKF